MSVKIRNLTVFGAAFAALFLLAVSLTTCDSPLGFGDSIDFEEPVLTLDPPDADEDRNPRYVGLSTILTGTVTDNVEVARIILRATADNPKAGIKRGDILGEAELIDSNPANSRWKMELNFTQEQNNEKLSVEIVAFDRAGNAGDRSIKAISLVVDIRPPVVEDIWIQRTDRRRAEFESYADLKLLEGEGALKGTDEEGERSANADRYQNGAFTIKAILSEDETRLSDLTLYIYDINKDANNWLLKKDYEGSKIFMPEWVIDEEELLNAGNARWANYKENYYFENTRYYYSIKIIAYDKSKNEIDNTRVKDKSCFVLWEKADIPKGIIDPLVSLGSDTINVTVGATLPVEFFDDDQMLWAFAGLLTEEQWKGTRPVASGVSISGADDAAKLTWLKNRLVNANGTPTTNPVYNWRYDLHSDTSAPITDVVATGNKDETSFVVQTSNEDVDSGTFKLFTLVADNKLDPHTAKAIDTYRTRDKLRVWTVVVRDVNSPLIVFDTVDTTDSGYPINIHPGGSVLEPTAGARTGNSPEENTFPNLTSNRYFELNGYILRANKKAASPTTFANTVTVFRMAWIPAVTVAKKDHDYIKDVENALKNNTNTWEAEEGVQYWNFTPTTGTPATYTPGTLLLGKGQYVGTDYTYDTAPVGHNVYSKQVFKKRFDVLGGTDDINDGTSGKPLYKNFTVNGTLENETKLFIVYAKDNMGHEVFRQIRLLPNKTPPTLTVYDLTDRTLPTAAPATPPYFKDGAPDGLPDLNNPKVADGANYYFYDSEGKIADEGRGRYENIRLWYQTANNNQVLTMLQNSITSVPLTSNDIAKTNAAYPQNTIIKYWAEAQGVGQLAVKSIEMYDLTFSNNQNQAGAESADHLKLGFVEKLSEVSQRVFMFEATDSLGNVARVQRTVAVTNAAILQSITTNELNGSYGIDKTITLRANFSNSVHWEGASPPELNVRYNYRGVQQVRSIPTKTPRYPVSNPYLEFDVIVEENDGGILETLYDGILASNGNTLPGNAANNTDRPITLPTGTRILDTSRGDEAYTPKNSRSFEWTSDKGSLQEVKILPAITKLIRLQGIRPVLSGFALSSVPSGKTYYDDANAGYYYKANETIEFTLTADKPIFTGSVDPIIQFQVANNAIWRNAAWSKASSAHQMSFSVLVDAAANTPPDGQITAIRLNDVRSIVDREENAFATGTGPYTNLPSMPAPDGGVAIIHIDKTAPTVPTVMLPGGTLLNGNSVTTIPTAIPTTTTVYYSSAPTLTITGDGGETAGTVIRQYSLNGGVSWTNYTAPVTGLANTNGTVILQARLIDRAGNIGAVVSQSININTKFPDLKSITAVQMDGFYPRDGNTLEFDLTFDAPVWTDSTAAATITLTNRNATNTHNTAGTTDTVEGVTYQSFAKLLTATAVSRPTTTTNATTTIRFEWTGITGKEMLDGLYVSAVNFAGLRDIYNNPGGATTTAPSVGGDLTISIPGHANQTCTNLSGAGLKVDCIAPSISTYAPTNGGVLPGNNPPSNPPANNRNRTITLTFNEKIVKGSGTITIRPRGNYAIPAVFENSGYYLGTDRNRYSSPSAAPNGVYTTYVDGFYDIYNKAPAGERARLTQGSDMSNLTLNARTGNSAGPYKRTTHGLKEGLGYSGNYSNTDNNVNTNGNATPNGPSPFGTYMIPDTATKWVLDYRYLIDSTTEATVTNIRDTLNNVNVKFRWQEIDVTSSNVSINTNGNGRVVTITLPEPLLDGLQWDFTYAAGTFTDEAGNNAPAITTTSTPAYWFWSSGVQAPVIRVNRRSFDARTSNWQSTNRAYNVPGNTGSWNTDTIDITDANGWGLTDYNVVHYRIETETPGATLTSGVRRGTNANNGAVNGAWTGTVQTANPNSTSITNDVDWTTDTDTSGTWVLPNLIRRRGSNNTPVSYTVTENGISVLREQSSGANYRGLRSYNYDATSDDLNGIPLAAFNAANRQGRIIFSTSTTDPSYEASKNYIAAQASINTNATYTAKGYEGVFRSVVMLNQVTYGGWVNDPRNSMYLVEGSNIKNGMPSIAGFPVRDAEETGDNRFIKVFHYTQNGNGGRFFWVSTEIVSQWYQLTYGQTHNQTGEVNNYLTAGYGDLTYSYNQR